MCHMLPPSCCLSATGVRFLGVLFPPRNSASLTVGLPPTSNVMDLTGLPRSTRMRYDRVGCQLYPKVIKLRGLGWCQGLSRGEGGRRRRGSGARVERLVDQDQPATGEPRCPSILSSPG